MRSIVIAGATGVFAAGAAWGHGGDIGLAVVNGRIATGIVEEVNGIETVVPGERVFGGELADFGGVPFGDEPGLFAMAGTFPDSELGFDFAGAVQVWDGDKFDPSHLSESSMTLRLGPVEATSPTDDVIAPGFAFGVGPDGFDEHYEYTLNPPAGDGIYLLPLNFWTSDSGVFAAKTAYLVFNWNSDDAEHDEAIGWVRQNYVPSPGAAAAVLVGGVMARRRR